RLATAGGNTPDGEDFLVRLWDVTSGKELGRFSGHRTAVQQVAFSADGKWLAASSSRVSSEEGNSRLDIPGAICVWELTTGKLARYFPVYGKDVVFSPDGHVLVWANPDKTHEVWDMVREKTLFSLGKEDLRCVFSPDGKTLAVGSSDRAV